MKYYSRLNSLNKKREKLATKFGIVSNIINHVNTANYYLEGAKLKYNPCTVDPALLVYYDRLDKLEYKINTKITQIENTVVENLKAHKKEIVFRVEVESYFDIISGQHKGCGTGHYYTKFYKCKGHKKDFKALKNAFITQIIPSIKDTFIQEAKEDALNYGVNRPDLKYINTETRVCTTSLEVTSAYTLDYALDPNTIDVTNKLTL